PPLYKAKVGKTERYLKDDHELNAFLMERAVEKRRVRLAGGQEIEGPRLIRLLDRMVGYSKLLAMVEKKGTPRALLERLLQGVVKGQARDAGAFRDMPRLQELIKPLRAAGADVVLEKDEEHGVYEIVLQVGANGQTREARVGEAFVSSPEYKALYSAYEEFRDLDQGPLVVVDGGETPVATREALLDLFLAEGQRGVAIQRYKGLGELNAEQLWEPTMDPAPGRPLQVRLEEEEGAENISPPLMGDAVEPRRIFIEENALNVRNLDI